ncbi:MAG: ATP-binding protein, partial [Treponema sp.]|nr:ATP-binding protein [Treponema sp.]
MFLGREKELESLENFFKKSEFGMCVMYGRRRIGKSYLLQEFSKNKNTVFYTATKVGTERNLELFSETLLNIIAPEL